MSVMSGQTGPGQTWQTRQTTGPAWTSGRLRQLRFVTMVAREKKEALIKWLGCYDVEIKALSDLRSGSHLLTLISAIDPALSPENVDPSQAFSKLEGFLSSFHGCLPAHFLSRAAHRGDASQLELATASVLALSALFLKAASPSGTKEVAPMMRLAQGVQERITEMLQVVTSGEDDVLTNLQAHLQASPDAESPESIQVKTKRKSSCFSYSPSPVRLPLKRVVDSPSRRSGPSAERAKEMKVLRRQLEEELQRAADLDKEIASRENTIARKDQEIKVLQQRIICLNSNLSDATSEGAALKQEISSLHQRNSFLEEQVRAMDTLKEAYDQVIRENSTLRQQSNDRADSEATILALQADVASALSAKDALEARLSEAEQQRHGFASQLAEKEHELTSLVEHYASRERRMPASPGTPPTPNTPVASCYVEMRVVELEEANQGLERDRDWLKAQLDSLTAQFNAEADRLQSSLAESEQALRSAEELGRTLRDEVSSLAAKLRVSEEETRALQEANVDLQTLVTTGGEQLQEVQSRLKDLSQRHAAAEQEAVASREANEALRLHNESLQSSLETSEGGRASAAQTVLALQEQLRQVLAAREEDKSSLHELRQHCEALSSRNEAGEALLKSTCAQLADAQASCDCLNNENRALNDRIRGFEVRMTDLLRLKEQAEDCYRNCFREKEENERHLKEQVQTLSSEARDSASLVEGLQAEVSRLSKEVDRLLREVERLAAEAEDARKRASDSLVQERELQEHLRVNGDRCEVLIAQCKLLDEQKEQLRVELKDLLHLKEQAEEDYRKAIEETEKSKDILQAQVDTLSSEARDSADSAERARAEVARLCEENGTLALRVERLGADVERVSKRARENLERRERELQERSEQDKARCEAATARCQLLEKEKEALRADLTAKLDSLTTQFNAEATRLRTSLTESEKAVLSMKELQARSQDEASSLGRKLRTSEEERDALLKANAELRAFATTGSQQLQDMRRQLDTVSQQRDSIGQEARSLQKAGEALQLQNQLLRSSLEASKAGKAAAEASCMEATQSIRALREQLQEALSARKDDEFSLQTLRQDCADLRAQNELGGASLESTRAELAEVLARCGRLDDENQALRDLVGDLEVQLKNLEHLKKRAEDDYYKCVEEKERHKDALKEHIEALASEARDSASAVRESQSEASKLREENGRLALEVERLKTEVEEAAKRASDYSERREKELLQESRLHVARCEAATARCELLEKENERLGADLKTAKESYGRKLQAAFSEMTTESNKRILAFKKREVTLREENEALKKKYEEEKASHEKREKLFHKHVNEMESRVTQTNEDIETLKAQLSENDGKLTTATSERDRLAMENRSLKAQLNYCELKMKERVKGSANSLSASNESLWSQKTSSGSLASLRSNSSLASDQFKVPLHRPSSRRDSTLRASSTSFAQPAALDTTIFSESRYSCDEEQDMFTHTNLTDLSRGPDEDPLGRYSELYRRNSMLQPHLKSSYPVETQTSKIPATPLKGTSSHVFTFAEASTSKQDEASKRKRSARSDSSGSGGAASGTTSDVVTASTPRASRGGTSRTGGVTPSSVKKFIKRTFKKS